MSGVAAPASSREGGGTGSIFGNAAVRAETVTVGGNLSARCDAAEGN